MTPLEAFAPFQDLAASLLAAAPGEATGAGGGARADGADGARANGADGARADGAHDHAHLLRVWRNAFTIAAIEGGTAEILAAAVLLHDGVAVEKNSPDRARASSLAAARAGAILQGLAWAPAAIAAVCHAIAAHSFSASIKPATVEARVLQDADRLDAIGAIGVARCFYTAGRMGSALYDPADPRAQHRKLDDAAYALDHFRAKLLGLHTGFQTETGRAMAAERGHRIAEFLTLFELEIGALD
jgi:uncharacterized protein